MCWSGKTLEDLSAVDVVSADTERLEGEVLEMERRARAFEAERLRRIAERDRRRGALEEAGVVNTEIARKVARDASVTRVVLSPRSEPLDVGRRTPVVPAAVRRAVIVRDGTCRFPGCDRPPPWCDAHHVRHWADGGETKLSNLILLCRPHHGLVHDGVKVRMEEGSPRFQAGVGRA